MKEKVKSTALRLINEHGLMNLSCDTLCARSGIPRGSFHYVMGVSFKTFVDQLREEGHHGPETAVTRGRIAKEFREQQILDAALVLARKHGYRNVKRTQLAEAAQCSDSLIRIYLGAVAGYPAKILDYAIQNESLEIVAQGLALQDPRLENIPLKLKQKALNHIAH